MSEQNPPKTALRIVLLLIGIVSFSATTFGLRLLSADDRPKFEDFTEQKLDEVSRLKNKPNTLFIGTSRVYRHINPTVFDKTTTDSGHATVSYNLGSPNMTWAEIEYLIEQIQSDPDFAECVFIVEPSFEAAFKSANATQSRYVRFTTPTNAWRSINLALIKPIKAPRKAKETAGILLSLTYNMTNAGTFGERIFTYPKPKDTYHFRPGLHGYVSLNQEDAERFKLRSQRFQEDLNRLGSLEAVLLNYSKKRPFGYTEAIRQRIETFGHQVSRQGGELILFNPVPLTNDLRSGLIDRSERGVFDWPILSAAYNVTEHPETQLLDPSCWFDHGHMSSTGTTLYSRLVAQEYLDHTIDDQTK